MGEKDLTAKMEAFVEACLDPDHTASDAYRLAYSTKNMAPQVIWNAASRLMNKPKIASRLQELRAVVSERAMVNATDILNELKAIGFSDLSQLVSWSQAGLTLKNSEDLPAELTALVSEVSETKHRDGTASVKIKLHDKLEALDKMAKMVGAYTATPETTVRITKITVVLPPDSDGGESRTETKVIEGNYEVLPDDDLPP